MRLRKKLPKVKMSFMFIAQHEYEEDIVRAVLSSLKGKFILLQK